MGKRKKFLCISIGFTRLVIFISILFMIVLLLSAFSLFAGCQTNSKKAGKLAIVIDDFGLQRKGVADIFNLDCKITVAIMPFLTHSENDAENGLENGKEIIIHIPMQATVHDNPKHLGPRPIKVAMTENEIIKWINDATDELPEAVGANIHMGTLSSTKEQIMVPILKLLKEKNLYFLDSKTSSKSICRKAAELTGIRFYENDVFLEHESKSKTYIKKRLEKAMKIACDRGECIAIGHVGYEGGSVTAEAINEMLPEFEKNNVELVFLSEISPMKLS